jgi:hypothetical protein
MKVLASCGRWQMGDAVYIFEMLQIFSRRI